ncbi:anti-sigma F factor antagonist [Fonticella tunisiensis]|uniref:Anti-sigma F factor antagonist n=1 Tax=Fonticella tunisiensis TaxID=1096341 RepID=A0A4R7KC81_9CLOT|nr:anti-sigma F factor antagonist [Fonticella tunisiensis]TDT50802.1 SpoIIAA-like anti-anti-sigma regulatory factor [Fonticella tunisiensis]
MNLKFSQKKGALVVTMLGELDHHSAERVRIKIDNKIDELGVKNLILDFSGVNFMDSSGIGVVIGRFRKVSEWGGKVAIVNLASPVKKVFELGGLFKIIKEYRDIDEAVLNL